MDHDVIFYDGHCGLCHRVVRRVLDADADRFRVAPLQGDTIRTLLSESQRAALPDSVVVLTTDGRLLTHGDAVLHILEHLDDRARAQAAWLRRVPRPLRQLGYHAVSATRYVFFRRQKQLCPVLTPAQRARCLP